MKKQKIIIVRTQHYPQLEIKAKQQKEKAVALAEKFKNKVKRK